VAVGEGGVWLTNADAGSVTRIDPTTGHVVATVQVGNEPERVLAGAGSVWVQTKLGLPALYRIDPTTDRITRKIDIVLEGLGPHAVWVTGGGTPYWGLHRIDANTLRPLGPTLGFDSGPVSVGVNGKALWVGKSFYYCELHNPIPEGPPIVSFAWFRVDPATLQPLSRPVYVGAGGLGMPVFAGGALWIVPEYGGSRGVITIDLAEASSVRARPTPGLPSPAIPAP
jgi:YVTN family beta-propeller protein